MCCLNMKFSLDPILHMIGTTEALYRALSKSKEVNELRLSIDAGTTTEAEIRDTAIGWLEHFKLGELLPYDLELAGLAVALEHNQSLFADAFITALANLRLAEIPSAVRVARLVRTRRIEPE